jgi:FMN phosphatase YigB (HAD superfamily)
MNLEVCRQALFFDVVDTLVDVYKNVDPRLSVLNFRDD